MTKYAIKPTEQLRAANISVRSDLSFNELSAPRSGKEASLTSTITAETILSGFRMYADGRVEITIPKNIPIWEARDLLLSEGQNRGKKFLGSGLRQDSDPSFFAMLQADPQERAIPGVTYEFQRNSSSVYGDLLEGKNPYPAFMLAQLCLQLQEDPHVTSLRTEKLSPSV